MHAASVCWRDMLLILVIACLHISTTICTVTSCVIISISSQKRHHGLDPGVEYVQVLDAEASNAKLKAKVKASEVMESAVHSELAELRERAHELAVKNELMQHDIACLTSTLVVCSAHECPFPLCFT